MIKNLLRWVAGRNWTAFQVVVAWLLIASYEADMHKSAFYIGTSLTVAALWSLVWLVGLA